MFIKQVPHYIVYFISMLDGIKYSNHKFSATQLCQTTANDVSNYLTKKAYGTVTPGPYNRPTEARANSPEFT